jgi:hypothetical protein
MTWPLALLHGLSISNWIDAIIPVHGAASSFKIKVGQTTLAGGRE